MMFVVRRCGLMSCDVVTTQLVWKQLESLEMLHAEHFQNVLVSNLVTSDHGNISKNKTLVS